MPTRTCALLLLPVLGLIGGTTGCDPHANPVAPASSTRSSSGAVATMPSAAWLGVGERREPTERVTPGRPFGAAPVSTPTGAGRPLPHA